MPTSEESQASQNTMRAAMDRVLGFSPASSLTTGGGYVPIGLTSVTGAGTPAGVTPSALTSAALPEEEGNFDPNEAIKMELEGLREQNTGTLMAQGELYRQQMEAADAAAAAAAAQRYQEWSNLNNQKIETDQRLQNELNTPMPGKFQAPK